MREVEDGAGCDTHHDFFLAVYENAPRGELDKLICDPELAKMLQSY